MRITSTFLLILTFTTLANPGLYSQGRSEWRQVIDRNGIEIRLYHAPEMNVRVLRGHTIVTMNMDSLEVLLDQVEKYHTWQHGVKETKIIHRMSTDRYHFHSRIQQGWPAKDRDLIWAVEKNYDPRTDGIFYDQVCSSNTLPEKLVEATGSQAFVTWRLEPIGESQIKVTYNLTVEQTGRIPTWILSMMDPNGPYLTLSRIKEMELMSDENVSLLESSLGY